MSFASTNNGPQAATETRMIGLSYIAIPPHRARKLRPEIVNELAESIRVHGLLHPIIVRPHGSSGYALVVGWHRLEAVKKLGLQAIRAEIREGMEANAAELAEIDENLVRAELCRRWPR
jgi:ParB family transcriptional regulator, chromosome partitioning protein